MGKNKFHCVFEITQQLVLTYQLHVFFFFFRNFENILLLIFLAKNEK